MPWTLFQFLTHNRFPAIFLCMCLPTSFCLQTADWGILIACSFPAKLRFYICLYSPLLGGGSNCSRENIKTIISQHAPSSWTYYPIRQSVNASAHSHCTSNVSHLCRCQRLNLHFREVPGSVVAVVLLGKPLATRKTVHSFAGAFHFSLLSIASRPPYPQHALCKPLAIRQIPPPPRDPFPGTSTGAGRAVALATAGRSSGRLEPAQQARRRTWPRRVARTARAGAAAAPPPPS